MPKITLDIRLRIMWTPLDWAEHHGYQVVILENVVDAHLWRLFSSWLQAWKSLDYEFQLVYFNSMHAHPTPQSRDRMYFVAWKRKNRRPNLVITPRAFCPTCEADIDAVQSWKNPARQYGKYRQQYVYCCPRCSQVVTPYYYAAINAIDWNVPAPRIGDRARPLRAKTLARIADGLRKFGETGGGQEGRTKGAVAPFLINLNHPEGRPLQVEAQPFPTQTAYDAMGIATPLASPFLLDHLGEYRPRPLTGPYSTICAAGNHHSLILPPTTSSWLMTYYQHGQLVPVKEAIPTVTTLDRHALVVQETPSIRGGIAVEDCKFRMLQPGEIQAAMAFPRDYQLTGTRREQVKQLDMWNRNAVTPPVMKLLMERVIDSLAGAVT